MQAVPFVLFALLVCTLAYGTWRTYPPHLLLALPVGIMAAITAAVAFVATGAFGVTTFVGGTRYDVSYFVFHRQLVLNMLFIVVLPILFTWAAYRFAKPTLLTLQRVCVWVVIIGLTSPGLIIALMARPRRYVDYPDWAQTIGMVTTIANGAATLSAALLLCIAVFALVFRRNNRAS